ncbi:RICIN domain-containing protein [Streptomyces gardneri]|uniref:RICIN domain-containing protein n=1 Tax=Streptomyces gardneri TaxID=66892 RepID=UPI0036CFFF3D
MVAFKANHSGKCLEVADWSTTNGAAVCQWTCTGGANQQWEQIPSNYSGEYYYRNIHSGKGARGRSPTPALRSLTAFSAPAVLFTAGNRQREALLMINVGEPKRLQE